MASSRPPPTAMPFTAAITGLFKPGNSCRPPNPPDTVVGVRRFAGGGGLEVPSGTEEALAGGRDDGDAQLRIVPEVREDRAHEAAGSAVDGVGLGAVQGHFQYAAAAFDMERIGHGASPWTVCMRASAAATPRPRGRAIRGFTSSSMRRSALSSAKRWIASTAFHQRRQIARGPAAKALQQRRGFQSGESGLDLGAARRGHQQGAVRCQFHPFTAGTEQQHQAHLGVPVDAHDQFRNAVPPPCARPAPSR